MIESLTNLPIVENVHACFNLRRRLSCECCVQFYDGVLMKIDLIRFCFKAIKKSNLMSLNSGLQYFEQSCSSITFVYLLILTVQFKVCEIYPFYAHFQ